MIIQTMDLVPLAERDLRGQVADLEERIDRYRAEYPTDADEFDRLVHLAEDLRRGGPRPSAPGVSREDTAEIDRLARLADSLRGSSAEDPASVADPDDQEEIARLATIAKERR